MYYTHYNRYRYCINGWVWGVRWVIGKLIASILFKDRYATATRPTCQGRLWMIQHLLSLQPQYKNTKLLDNLKKKDFIATTRSQFLHLRIYTLIIYISFTHHQLFMFSQNSIISTDIMILILYLLLLKVNIYYFIFLLRITHFKIFVKIYDIYIYMIK